MFLPASPLLLDFKVTTFEIERTNVKFNQTNQQTKELQTARGVGVIQLNISTRTRRVLFVADLSSVIEDFVSY